MQARSHIKILNRSEPETAGGGKLLYSWDREIYSFLENYSFSNFLATGLSGCYRSYSYMRELIQMTTLFP